MLIDLIVTILVIAMAVTTVYLDRCLLRETTAKEQAQAQLRRLILEDSGADLTVDAHILRLQYCLGCHVLKPPSHYVLTDHLALGDNDLQAKTLGS